MFLLQVESMSVELQVSLQFLCITKKRFFELFMPIPLKCSFKVSLLGFTFQAGILISYIY